MWRKYWTDLWFSNRTFNVIKNLRSRSTGNSVIKKSKSSHENGSLKILNPKEQDIGTGGSWNIRVQKKRQDV